MSLLKRGTIKSYDSAAHRASVQIAGSLGVWLDAIPVATDVPAAEVVAGRECAVLFFTDDNPNDAVVLTVHGAVPAAAVGIPDKIRDADQDTRAEVEASPNEDKFRLTIAGTLRYLAQAAAPHHQLTGDVQVDRLGVGVAPAAGYQLHVQNTGAITSSAVGLALLTTALSLAANGAAYFGFLANPAVTVTGAVTGVSATGMDFTMSLTGGAAGAVVSTAYNTNVQLRTTNLNATITEAVAYRVKNPLFLIATNTTITKITGLEVLNLGNARVQTAYGVRIAALSLATVAMQPFREEGSTAGDAHGNRFRSNSQFGSLTGSFGGGDGVIGLANATVEPASTPTGGGVLFASAGELRWLSSGGRTAYLSPLRADRTLANGANNNLDPADATLVRIAGPTAAFSITGITGGYDGRVLYLHNTTAQNMTIANDNAGSLASARILTMTGADIATAGIGAVALVYDGASARWIVVSLQA